MSPRGESLKPDMNILRPCMKVALPNMLQRFGTSLGYVAFAAMINSLGGRAEATDDGLIIHGVKRFTGGQVDGFRDHRIVMAAAIGALCADGEVTITTPHSVNKSYPSFFEVYNSLGGKANVIDMGQ